MTATIKELTRELIESTGGLLAAEAALSGRAGRSTLATYYSQNHKECIPADVLCRLTMLSQNHDLLAFIAARCGFRLTRMDEATEPGCAVQGVAAVMQKVGAAAGVLAEGMSDGVLDAAELERVEHELGDVAREAAAQQSAVHGARLRLVAGGR